MQTLVSFLQQNTKAGITMVGVGNRKHKCVKKKNIQVFAWDVELKSKKKFFADLFFYVKTSLVCKKYEI